MATWQELGSRIIDQINDSTSPLSREISKARKEKIPFLRLNFLLGTAGEKRVLENYYNVRNLVHTSTSYWIDVTYRDDPNNLPRVWLIVN